MGSQYIHKRLNAKYIGISDKHCSNILLKYPILQNVCLQWFQNIDNSQPHIFWKSVQMSKISYSNNLHIFIEIIDKNNVIFTTLKNIFQKQSKWSSYSDRKFDGEWSFNDVTWELPWSFLRVKVNSTQRNDKLINSILHIKGYILLSVV